MPDSETILEIMEEHGLDLDEAKEVADLMDEYDIDDVDDAVEMYESL